MATNNPHTFGLPINTDQIFLISAIAFLLSIIMLNISLLWDIPRTITLSFGLFFLGIIAISMGVFELYKTVPEVQNHLVLIGKAVTIAAGGAIITYSLSILGGFALFGIDPLVLPYVTFVLLLLGLFIFFAMSVRYALSPQSIGLPVGILCLGFIVILVVWPSALIGMFGVLLVSVGSFGLWYLL